MSVALVVLGFNCVINDVEVGAAVFRDAAVSAEEHRETGADDAALIPAPVLPLRTENKRSFTGSTFARGTGTDMLERRWESEIQINQKGGEEREILVGSKINKSAEETKCTDRKRRARLGNK